MCVFLVNYFQLRPATNCWLIIVFSFGLTLKHILAFYTLYNYVIINLCCLLASLIGYLVLLLLFAYGTNIKRFKALYYCELERNLRIHSLSSITIHMSNLIIKKTKIKTTKIPSCVNYYWWRFTYYCYF